MEVGEDAAAAGNTAHSTLYSGFAYSPKPPIVKGFEELKSLNYQSTAD